MHLTTMSFLVPHGHDEDGGLLAGEALRVVAEADDGRRWAHVELGGVVTAVEYGDSAPRVVPIPGARARVEAAVAAGPAGPELAPEAWEAIEPRYGSKAYAARWV
jgi:hypothetical protein